MCVDMCVDMCTDMCVDMCVDTCFNTCMSMCMDNAQRDDPHRHGQGHKLQTAANTTWANTTWADTTGLMLNGLGLCLTDWICAQRTAEWQCDDWSQQHTCL